MKNNERHTATLEQYCQTEQDKGHCNNYDCAYCPVNALYNASEEQAKRKPMYRIVLTCWDNKEKPPYSDHVPGFFLSEEEAQKAVRSCVRDELETLNGRDIDDSDIEGPFEYDCYKADFDGDEFDAIIRYWDNDDYWPVTGYSICEITPCMEHSWTYRKTNYHFVKNFVAKYNRDNPEYAFYIRKHEKDDLFAVSIDSDGTRLAVRRTLEFALDFVDEYILQIQNNKRAELLKKRETKK